VAVSAATSLAGVLAPGAIATVAIPWRAHSIESVRARFSSPAHTAGAYSPASGAGAR
jgi:hypothetical protein